MASKLGLKIITIFYLMMEMSFQKITFYFSLPFNFLDSLLSRLCGLLQFISLCYIYALDLNQWIGQCLIIETCLFERAQKILRFFFNSYVETLLYLSDFKVISHIEHCYSKKDCSFKYKLHQIWTPCVAGELSKDTF